MKIIAEEIINGFIKGEPHSSIPSKNRKLYHFSCKDCGTKSIATISNVRQRKGCYVCRNKKFTGKSIKGWNVTNITYSKGSNTYYVLECKHGNLKHVASSNLTSKYIKECDCE